MKLIIFSIMLLVLEAKPSCAAEKVSLNAGLGILACESKDETFKCTVPAHFAGKLDIELTQERGQSFSSGSREFSEIRNGHLFHATILVKKFVVDFVAFYSLTVSMSSEANKHQSLGSIYFSDSGKLNLVYWNGAEILEGNIHFIPVLVAASPTENLAPLREEILQQKFKK